MRSSGRDCTEHRTGRPPKRAQELMRLLNGTARGHRTRQPTPLRSSPVPSVRLPSAFRRSRALYRVADAPRQLPDKTVDLFFAGTTRHAPRVRASGLVSRGAGVRLIPPLRGLALWRPAGDQHPHHRPSRPARRGAPGAVLRPGRRRTAAAATAGTAGPLPVGGQRTRCALPASSAAARVAIRRATDPTWTARELVARRTAPCQTSTTPIECPIPICRAYTTKDCAYKEDWVYGQYFETAEQVVEYMDAVLGPGGMEVGDGRTKTNPNKSIRSHKPPLLPVLASPSMRRQRSEA